MQLISNKLSSILFSITFFVLSAHSAVVARHDLDELSVVFFDEIDEQGGSYSPDDLVPGICNTLPGDWLHKAESVMISPGFNCSFYEWQGCEGPPTALTGTVDELPAATLYNNTKSFFCTKEISMD